MNRSFEKQEEKLMEFGKEIINLVDNIKDR
jgi:hypothetical protein